MNRASAIDRKTEAAWRFAFAAAGRILQTRACPPVEVGGRRVLVVAPHPDDETLGCAGAIRRHAGEGDPVTLAFITDGSRSRAGGHSADEMRSLRQAEAEHAAELLGALRLEWFGLPEGEWTFEQLKDPLLRMLERTGPDVIYAPSRIDFHPEHLRVASGLACALSRAGLVTSSCVTRVIQLQVPLTPVLTNRIVDCSGISAEIVAAASVYRSQAANIGRALRMRRYTAGLYGLREFGEEYWQMPVADYCRLHDGPPQHWHTECFRGIRFRSFSDPLAYCAGIRERRHLRRMAEAPGG